MVVISHVRIDITIHGDLRNPIFISFVVNDGISIDNFLPHYKPNTSSSRCYMSWYVCVFLGGLRINAPMY